MYGVLVKELSALSFPGLKAGVCRAFLIKDYNSAPKEARIDAENALKKLLINPKAKPLRLEKLKGYDSIYSIHISKNNAYKITFLIDGDVAILRRLDTHKSIDRYP